MVALGAGLPGPRENASGGHRDDHADDLAARIENRPAAAAQADRSLKLQQMLIATRAGLSAAVYARDQAQGDRVREAGLIADGAGKTAGLHLIAVAPAQAQRRRRADDLEHGDIGKGVRVARFHLEPLSIGQNYRRLAHALGDFRRGHDVAALQQEAGAGGRGAEQHAQRIPGFFEGFALGLLRLAQRLFVFGALFGRQLLQGVRIGNPQIKIHVRGRKSDDERAALDGDDRWADLLYNGDDCTLYLRQDVAAGGAGPGYLRYRRT